MGAWEGSVARREAEWSHGLFYRGVLGSPGGADTACPCVQDPSGNRIAQWREVSPRQGIVDLSLPLAAEPALGTYIIEVEGKTRSFSVEEYGTWGPAGARRMGVPPRHVPVGSMSWPSWPLRHTCPCPGRDSPLSICFSISAAQV